MFYVAWVFCFLVVEVEWMAHYNVVVGQQVDILTINVPRVIISKLNKNNIIYFY